MKRNLLQTYLNQIQAGTIRPEFSRELQAFCQDETREQAYLSDPAGWFERHYPQWSQQERHLFNARFNQLRQANDFDNFSG